MERSAADERKRLLLVTPGNLRQNHLYVRGHYDFFPADCIGPARKARNGADRHIAIFLDGLNETIETDIGADPKTGKPRAFFRGRTWVRRFFQHHQVNPGDQLSLERLDARRYRLTVAGTKPEACTLTPAEFFADIGLEQER